MLLSKQEHMSMFIAAIVVGVIAIVIVVAVISGKGKRP
jgi:hypothetical protein